MINFILEWLRLDKRTTKMETSLERLEFKIQRTHEAALVVAKRTETRVAEAEKAASRLQQETKSLLSSLDEYRITVVRLEEALEATREELRTAKQITIPGLVEANQTMITRWEAETAIHVARASLVRKEE